MSLSFRSTPPVMAHEGEEDARKSRVAEYRKLDAASWVPTPNWTVENRKSFRSLIPPERCGVFSGCGMILNTARVAFHPHRPEPNRFPNRSRSHVRAHLAPLFLDRYSAELLRGCSLGSVDFPMGDGSYPGEPGNFGGSRGGEQGAAGAELWTFAVEL
jgi:hypothetical protein